MMRKFLSCLLSAILIFAYAPAIPAENHFDLSLEALPGAKPEVHVLPLPDKELPLQDSLPYDARPGLNLDQSLEDLPLRADLQSALSKISEAPRLALTLLYYQGMIHQEAGEVLGKTPAQVARLAQQGRQTLKRLLAE